MTKNEKLKQSRQNKGLTQAEFASMLGVKQAYISGIETTQTFGIKKAKEIAKILDVDPVWLYNDDKIGNELSQKSNIAQKAKNELIDNNTVEEIQIPEVNSPIDIHKTDFYKELPVNRERIKDKDELYSQMSSALDNQQEAILQLLTTTRVLKNQLELLKQS